MLLQSSAFLILLLQVISSDGIRTCFNNCTISGLRGVPLVVPDKLCSKVVARYCGTSVSFLYHTGEYTVDFRIEPVAFESRLIFLVPDHLGYSVTHSCSDTDSCALEFAQTKVLELSDRRYRPSMLWADLAPLIGKWRFQEAALTCFDNEECSGRCRIDYNMISNLEKIRGCYTFADFATVSVTDGDTSASFELGCTRTNCNSLDTFNRVKTILTSYNLTDTNGRIPKEPTSTGGC